MGAAQETRQPQPGKIITRKRPILGRGQPMSASIKPLGVLFVSSKAPFMSVVNRAIKMLDKGPGGARWSATKVPPLAERISKVQQSAAGTLQSNAMAFDALPLSNIDSNLARQREVLLLASGRAIDKLVLIAAWFRRQEGYITTVRTRWSSTIDDVFSTMDNEGLREPEAKDGGVSPDDPSVDDGMDIERQDLERLRHVDESVPHRTARVRNVSCLEVAVRLK